MFKNRKVLKRYIYACFIIISFMFFMTACGSGNKESKVEMRNEANKEDRDISKSESKDMDYRGSMESEEYGSDKVENESNSDENKSEVEENKTNIHQKIIKTEEYSIETLKFNEDKNGIVDRVKKYGGYIENSEITGRGIDEEYSRRYAHFVLRVPSDKLENFKNDVETIGSITNQNTSSEDITLKYYDSEARLKSLKIQEERLLEMLKKAEELKDLFQIEQQLQDVRYRIETMTGTIRKWDNLVEYSTVIINLHEVLQISKVEKQPTTWGDKIEKAFKNSIKSIGNGFKSLVVIIVAIIPYLIIIIPVSILLIKLCKKYKNKK